MIMDYSIFSLLRNKVNKWINDLDKSGGSIVRAKFMVIEQEAIAWLVDVVFANSQGAQLSEIAAFRLLGNWGMSVSSRGPRRDR